MTRQRKWQLKVRAIGKCIACGKDRERLASYCDACAKKRRAA